MYSLLGFIVITTSGTASADNKDDLFDLPLEDSGNDDPAPRKVRFR